MNQQQIQLRLLHQKHINNLLALQHQRALLNKDNPYKQTFIEHPKPTNIDTSRLPLLKSDPYVEKMLYYPPSTIQGALATKAIDNILISWKSQCNKFPENIYLDKMLRYNKTIDFQSKLGRRGLQQVEEQLKFARKNYVTRPHMTIKQKYGQSYRGNLQIDIPNPSANKLL